MFTALSCTVAFKATCETLHATLELSQPVFWNAVVHGRVGTHRRQEGEQGHTIKMGREGGRGGKGRMKRRKEKEGKEEAK